MTEAELNEQRALTAIDNGLAGMGAAVTEPDGPVAAIKNDGQAIESEMKAANSGFPNTDPEAIAETLDRTREQAEKNIEGIETIKANVDGSYQIFCRAAETEIENQKLTVKMMQAAAAARVDPDDATTEKPKIKKADGKGGAARRVPRQDIRS